MRVALAQFTPSDVPADNLRGMAEIAASAAARGAQLLVFPEQSMLLLSRASVAYLGESAAKWWPEFYARLRDLAMRHSLYVVGCGFAPAITVAGSAGAAVDSAGAAALPYNTMVAFAPNGSELAIYHKVHLYHAFGASETLHTAAGQQLPPVFTVQDGKQSLRCGLANCYDLRFPELFRSLLERGAEAFIVGAAWAAGPGKERHWELLSASRALENVSFMLASATCGESTIGLSRVVDPLGNVLATLGASPDLLVVDIDPAEVNSARKILPAVANRRITADYRLP